MLNPPGKGIRREVQGGLPETDRTTSDESSLSRWWIGDRSEWWHDKWMTWRGEGQRTVDGWFRNPAWLTSWFGKYAIIYKVFIHPRWCRIPWWRHRKEEIRGEIGWFFFLPWLSIMNHRPYRRIFINVPLLAEIRVKQKHFLGEKVKPSE